MQDNGLITVCILIDGYQCFRRTCCPHLVSPLGIYWYRTTLLRAIVSLSPSQYFVPCIHTLLFLHGLLFYPEDKGRRFIENNDTHLPNYRVSHFRRL
jgi:hypothetical protein